MYLSIAICERFNYSNDSLYGFAQIICLLQVRFPEFAFYSGISEVLPMSTFVRNNMYRYNNNICRPCNIYESPSASYLLPLTTVARRRRRPNRKPKMSLIRDDRDASPVTTTKLMVCVAETHNYYYGLNECRIEM